MRFIYLKFLFDTVRTQRRERNILRTRRRVSIIICSRDGIVDNWGRSGAGLEQIRVRRSTNRKKSARGERLIGGDRPVTDNLGPLRRLHPRRGFNGGSQGEKSTK
jgi:hypothetical protein